jgi:hypothetical protein
MIKRLKYYFGDFMYKYHNSMLHELHDEMNVIEFGCRKWKRMLRKRERHTKMMKLWLRFKWGDSKL